MREFKDILEAYGVDYEETMGRFAGNESLYLKCLDLLYQDENLQALDAALESGDLTTAFEAAHSLKGAIGNMGLTPLYDAVCTIVEPLRARERECDYPVLLQAVRSEYEKTNELRARLKGGRGI